VEFKMFRWHQLLKPEKKLFNCPFLALIQSGCPISIIKKTP
jgi:hypothetical protein